MNALIVSALTLIGTWQYAGFRYEGREYPKPNPDLELTFTFDEDGTSTLYWHRTNIPDSFCERRGIYRLDDNMLWQKTTWVNPRNAAECSRDPDMQPDRETTTPILIYQNEIDFVFELNGRELLYILSRAQSVP